MRNRAKCKLCSSILESFHQHDFVTCKCGEISIDGGQSFFKASAKDFKNFLRVDDIGNEIIVTVKDEVKTEEKTIEEVKPPTKAEKLQMLDEMVKSIEGLPQQAMTLPINHYDFYSALLLLSSILKE
jgi:hypothetical protein